MSPPTPAGGAVSGTATGVVPGAAPAAVGSPVVGSPTSCPLVPAPVSSLGAQAPFKQISPAAQSAPLLQATPPTAGWTGTGPPSNALAAPGASPMAASMASPRKTRRRLAR